MGDVYGGRDVLLVFRLLFHRFLCFAKICLNDDAACCLQIMRKNPVDLRRRLFIQFREEEGLDYGGIARCV